MNEVEEMAGKYWVSMRAAVVDSKAKLRVM